MPTVTTQAVNHIAQRGAIGNGNITALGTGGNCDEFGFVWDTVTHTLPGNVAPGSSGYTAFTSVISDSRGTGAFSSTSAGGSPVTSVGPLGLLVSNTTYFVRAFAHSLDGYAYGGEVSFTTLATYPGCVGFMGGETGSISAVTSNLTEGFAQNSGGSFVATISTLHVFSGNYAYSLLGQASLNELVPTVLTDTGGANAAPNSSRMYAVAKFYFATLANTTQYSRIFGLSPPNSAHIVFANINLSGQFQLFGNGNNGHAGSQSTTLDILGNSHTFVLGQWYTIYLSYVDTTGQCEMIIDDGTNQYTYRVTTDQGWPVGQAIIQNSFTTGDIVYVDDFIAHSDAYYPGKVIARQGRIATPTYDAWTKNGGTVISDVWNDTPFSTATSASSSTALAAQTMVVSSFSATQTGHGTDVINSGDTIIGVRVMLTGKAASAVTPSIRRVVNGVTTDFATDAFNTTDLGFIVQSEIFTDTLANINAMEGGVVKDNSATLVTIEDIWFIAAYVPAAVVSVVGLARNSVSCDDQWLGGDWR